MVDRQLADAVRGRDPMAIAGAWMAMQAAVRNLGRPGIAAHAIEYFHHMLDAGAVDDAPPRGREPRPAAGHEVTYGE